MGGSLAPQKTGAMSRRLPITAAELGGTPAMVKGICNGNVTPYLSDVFLFLVTHFAQWLWFFNGLAICS